MVVYIDQLKFILLSNINTDAKTQTDIFHFTNSSYALKSFSI